MIHRIAAQKLQNLAATFKAVAVTGARQSGKTTLVKELFAHKPYVSLESPDVRAMALDDPRGFLKGYPQGAVLDEVQRVPELFSYLQEILDNSREKGLFILTGSNNFLLQQNITQTLAGRIAYLHLLPFSLAELANAGLLPRDDNTLMLKGFYPPIYDQNIPAQEWSRNYIRTYVERDVRQLKAIPDLIVFERFMRLLAGRNGQELNYSALAVEVGVDAKTITSWVGILESSFIVFLLRPHHRNFNKTIVKRAKVYFHDTALVCSLLGISDTVQLVNHPLRGAIFEGMVVAEMLKRRENLGLPNDLYFWRSKAGHEVDVLVDRAGQLFPIEIKSGMTVHPDHMRNLRYYMNLSGEAHGALLHAGPISQHRSDGIEVINWRNFREDLQKEP